jgi:hypothetical protein
MRQAPKYPFQREKSKQAAANSDNEGKFVKDQSQYQAQTTQNEMLVEPNSTTVLDLEKNQTKLNSATKKIIVRG